MNKTVSPLPLEARVIENEQNARGRRRRRHVSKPIRHLGHARRRHLSRAFYRQVARWVTSEGAMPAVG